MVNSDIKSNIFSLCRASTPHSDTESSDEDDDVSDHDLTPCNPSPNMSQLLGNFVILKLKGTMP